MWNDLHEDCKYIAKTLGATVFAFLGVIDIHTFQQLVVINIQHSNILWWRAADSYFQSTDQYCGIFPTERTHTNEPFKRVCVCEYWTCCIQLSGSQLILCVSVPIYRGVSDQKCFSLKMSAPLDVFNLEINLVQSGAKKSFWQDFWPLYIYASVHRDRGGGERVRSVGTEPNLFFSVMQLLYTYTRFHLNASKNECILK